MGPVVVGFAVKYYIQKSKENREFRATESSREANFLDTIFSFTQKLRAREREVVVLEYSLPKLRGSGV